MCEGVKRLDQNALLHLRTFQVLPLLPIKADKVGDLIVQRCKKKCSKKTPIRMWIMCAFIFCFCCTFKKSAFKIDLLFFYYLY